MNDFKEIIKILKNDDNFIVATHMNPEGDAIGSALGLAGGLKEHGKNAVVYCKDAVPSNLMFLPFNGLATTTLPDLTDTFTAIVVDCSDLERVGEAFGKKKFKKIICLDHHKTSIPFGSLNLINKEASAAGEIVYLVLINAFGKISQDIANCLYTAISTDTGGFKYSNTTPKSLKVSASLLEEGANPVLIAENLFENNPLRKVLLLGEVLKTLNIRGDGRIAQLYLLQESFKKTGSYAEDAEGFINHARGIEGVKVAILYRELEEGGFKVSLRSKGDVDVSIVAVHFGGGGHKNAAGCKVNSALSEAEEKILKEVAKILK